MSIWTVLKIFVGFVVAGVMVFSGLLAWHIMVEPQGGIFEKIVPNTRKIVGQTPETVPVTLPKTGEIPKVDPGMTSFEKATELLALAKHAEAREKLANIVSSYPGSAAAPRARKILTEMNLDEILSSAHREGKQMVTVKRGDSFLAIAARNQTTLEFIEHLNSMQEMRALHPGEELLVASLNYRLILEPKKKSVSLWAGENFVAEWPALEMSAISPTHKPVRISAKPVYADGKHVTAQSSHYRMGEKTIQIAGAGLWIRSWNGKGEKTAAAVLLSPADMEDLFLLTRVGNEVMIR